VLCHKMQLHKRAQGNRMNQPWLQQKNRSCLRLNNPLLTAMVAMACLLPTLQDPALAADAGWPNYGGDKGGQRHISAAQITPDNVGQLQEVWRYRTGDDSGGIPSRDRRAFEATPILHDGILYLSTPYGQVHAI